MNLWTLPSFDFATATPSPLHVGDVEAEKRKAGREIELKFHRLPASTELKEFGAADQLTRLSNILKDAPRKKGLTTKPVHHIPPLAVLNGQLVELGQPFVWLSKEI